MFLRGNTEKHVITYRNTAYPHFRNGYPEEFGDFQFVIKLTKGLRNKLNQHGYFNDILIYVDGEDEKKFYSKHFDKDEGILAVTCKDIVILGRNYDLIIDYHLSGPLINNWLPSGFNANKHTPVLFLPEYGVNIDTMRINLKYKGNIEQFAIFETGPGSKMGMIIAEHSQEFKEEQDGTEYTLSMLDNADRFLNDILFSGKTLEEYQQNSEFSFAYCTGKTNRTANENLDNSTESFLRAHHIFYTVDQKYQKKHDILLLGGDENKEFAVQNMLETFFASGFSKVYFYDLDNNTRKEYKKQPGKNQAGFFKRLTHPICKKQQEELIPKNDVCRIFSKRRVKSSTMPLLFALSGRLCGTTGDQSFCEAMSHKKIIFYEIRSHKNNLAKKFVAAIKKYSTEEAGELAELLQQDLVKLHVTAPEYLTRLKQLLQTDAVIKEYYFACKKILEKNLIDAVFEKISCRIESRAQPHEHSADIKIFQTAHR